ncbi:MAG: Histidinol-phosphate aminotransferase [uncultured Chloroflexi bacterium]|uniref:Histidinol-phosphate aminotransferase n=1 Tax=uncultured Chloroflexota bacterium TaxID=166587 RepID=A0A6J4K3G1_9CHLR|nr:MAG: Histidinol-phosphate aminotransferase [uncultured Chloroflexota bacterium]
MIRDNVAALHAYMPGEQPQGAGWVKLNTNENPFMAPSIADAVAEASTDVLRLYPDPLCLDLRRALSERYSIPAEQIVCGNGSDDLLTMVVRATAGEGDRVAYPDPTYSLYETLTQIQGAFPLPVPLGPEWELPVEQLAAVGAKLTFVANPNAPTGTPYSLDQLDALAGALAGVLVVDEAYVDFGGETALPLLARHDNVLVLRTMSKAFGLAGVRLGFGFGSPAIVDALYKVKDSYNVDRLTQVAGVAALRAYDEAQAYNRDTAARRDRLAALLRERFGWRVWPSAANFILAETAPRSARDVYEGLKQQRILVRYFDRPRIENALRITIGSDPEVAALVQALDRMLR